MAKKICSKNTNFEDLHLFLGYTREELEKKKARLFPIGNSKSETSATSIFLASLSAVKEYREALMSSIGIKKLNIKYVELHTYVEVDDKDNGNRPDGLIVITSGKNKPIIEWTCFVESKVGINTIDDNQIKKYIEFARKIGIDDVITISNQLVTNPKQTPVKIRTGKNMNLYHWSWPYLKVTARKLVDMKCIQDGDHEYILTELRRYFDSNEKISNYAYMGKEWESSVKEIHNFQGKKIEKKLLSNIVCSYAQEEKDIGLQLTDGTKSYIELVTKSNNRIEELEKMMNDTKIIKSDYIMNDNKNLWFTIEVNFLSKTVKCYTHIIINNGKAKAQTSALLRMFDKIAVTEDIKIKAIYSRNKTLPIATSLSILNEEKKDIRISDYSILNKDLGSVVKHFEIMTEVEIGEDFKAPRKFITKLEEAAKRFVEQVMENKK